MNLSSVSTSQSVSVSSISLDQASPEYDIQLLKRTVKIDVRRPEFLTKQSLQALINQAKLAYTIALVVEEEKNSLFCYFLDAQRLEKHLAQKNDISPLTGKKFTEVHYYSNCKQSTRFLYLCARISSNIKEVKRDWVRDYLNANEGDVEAQIRFADCLVTKDEAQAFYWLKEAAMAGHREAQFRLSRCYAKGQGVAKDKKLAFYWLKRASSARCP